MYLVRNSHFRVNINCRYTKLGVRWACPTSPSRKYVVNRNIMCI